MSRIQLLSQDVVSKIAAGEVIERPASVVKELVENSIDAGATRIEVELVEGGKKLIRVVDDGIGIGPDDLEKVFLKHATSKIAALEDLEAVNTMGFRGEALASIGAVSIARIASCARDGLQGAEIEVRGGKRSRLKYIGTPEGTRVEVKELFYNVPARRKFLKATPAEMSGVSDVLTKLVLSHPEVHFTFSHNGREVFNLPSAPSLRDRIAVYYGGELAQELLPINSREYGLEVSGYVLPPTHYRLNTRMQFIFLNNRPIRDPGLTRAVNEAYRTLLQPGRYPVVFLLLRIDPAAVDVNVHPAKLEVRFREPARVYAQVLQAIRRALDRFQPGLVPPSDGVSQIAATPTVSSGSSVTAGVPSTGAPGVIPSMPQPARAGGKGVTAKRGQVVQLHSAYIVEEVQGGINIIDQHALHEAMLYHEIRETVQGGALPAQRLLMPELLELSPADFYHLLELRDALERLGLELEEFGRNSIIVRSIPQILKDVDIKELIDGLLEDTRGQPADERMLNHIIEAMACKGAIKSGHRLSPQELSALLERRNENSRLTYCPHGRPTTLFFSLEELDRRFKKTAK